MISHPTQNLGHKVSFLDTSSLRSASKRLSSIKSIGRCFTSAFALVELLNGIRQDDIAFSRRSATIRAVLNSGLKIDWTMPEGWIACAFQLSNFKEHRIKDLQKIVGLIKACHTLEGLETELAEMKLRFSLDFFEEYDEEFGRAHIAYAMQEHPKLRHGFNEWRDRVISTRKVGHF